VEDGNENEEEDEDIDSQDEEAELMKSMGLPARFA
jgi:hypothetical protein